MDRPVRMLTRRDFVRLAGLAGAAGAVGPYGVAALAQAAGEGGQVELPLTVPVWTRSQGFYPPLVGLDPERRFTPLGVPDEGALFGGLSPQLIEEAPPSVTVHRTIDPDSTRLKPEYHSPIQDLEGDLTPNGLTYIIAHGRVPIITPSEHHLLVHGDQLARPKVFTMEDLRRFPSVTVTHFLECAGNTYQAWAQNGTAGYDDLDVQLSHGLLSGVRWTGVPVRHVLRSCGIRWTPGQARRLWVLAEGADGAVLDRSVPMEKMMDDAIIAFAQNGRPLQRENGYPIRLILPGYEGNMNVKWLRRLKVGTEPWMTKEETSGYTDYVANAGRGDSGPGRAWQFTLPMEVKSVITSPAGGQRLEPPRAGSVARPVVRGIAWSGRGRITRVEVRIGDGPWADAELPPAVLPMALTPFVYRGWAWDGGSTWLSSRAWDETGMVQVDFRTLARWRGIDSVYHYNAIQTWRVERDGRVLNHAQTI